jgi:DNA-directed RNA polymerase subunit beta
MPPILRPVVEDAETRRKMIREKVVEGLTQSFPLKAGKHTLELSNVRVEPRDYSSLEQKHAVLEGRTLSERVRGDVTVLNAAGATVDHAKDFTLMQLPYFTPRHTFIVDGTEYSVANQLRTKSGVYVRRRGNEELETTFNLSKGANFRVSMDAAKGLLFMQPSHATTKIPLHPILQALGMPHQDIAKSWGSEIAGMNRAAWKNPDTHVAKLYETLVHPAKQTAATPEEKARVLREYFHNTSMDPDVNQHTLGHPYDKASPVAILAASKKMLDVHRTAADVDDRDSLAFKTFHSVDDFMKERVALDARAMRSKLGWKLDASHGNIKKALPAGPFTRSLHGFLVGSSLSAVPMQINPMELLDEAARVTMLGDGAIASERAIPLEARDVHSTHFGIIDPARTPESFKIGVDLRMALGARRDDAGNLYAPVYDVAAKKTTYLKAGDMSKSVVAFPGEHLGAGKIVDAMANGVVTRVKSQDVTHQLEHVAAQYGPTSNMLPLIYGIQANRVLMASKHQGQALPLTHREAPLVQVASWKPGVASVEQDLIKQVVPTARIAGTITKIDDGWIHIEPHTKHAATATAAPPPSVAAGTRIHYDTYFPLAAKTMLHNTLTVKVGDRVEAGQTLASSNFSKDDTLALGTNLRVAYMPYRGLNTNDGIVVSQGAADKLLSEHMYQHSLSSNGTVQLGREKHRTYFGSRYGKTQYENLDDDGVVKPGVTLHKGDLIMAGVRENKAIGDAALLGKLSKSLVKPFEEIVETWQHDRPGVVVDVAKTSAHAAASIRTQEALQVGDKLANRFGNKGVIAKIVPDHQMIQDASGRVVDLLFTSAGIVSRINPAQVVETALGKVAEKIGKPIIVPQYTPGRDNVQYAKDLLKQHGLADKETVLDPITGKQIPNVVVGKSYILKLFKTTDSNWAAHGAERYDYNQQPARGGDDGAKGLGKMEFDGLVAHNARNVLREAASIKSQRNDEFWRAVQLGLPTPSPKTPFAYDKLQSMLTGAGVKVTKTGSHLALGPLTDADVTKMSSGALQDPSKLIRAKDLRPETHGLFDPGITGGMAGTKWSHVDLHEPIVNPVFEEPVRRLLGLTQREFNDRVGKGGHWFKDALGDIKVDDKIKSLRLESRQARGPALDGVVKQIKYLEALQAHNLKPSDAYVISKVPVTPPVIRPILPLSDGRLQVSDANLLYKDAFLANDQLRTSAKLLPSTELPGPRQHLYDAVSALYGVGDPVSPSAEKRGAKGYLAAITGTRPGSGFFQAKLMKRQQDVSGRATIAPDPTLSMDEIGVPEGMLWGMYGKFVVGRLVRQGYTALDAQKMVEDKTPRAHTELVNEARERPVMINRAPSLHRFNIIGAYPKMIEGKTIKLNPFAEKGMNADYDGDALQIHAPVTQGGIDDVKRMTLSNLIFADKRPGVLNVVPDMEAVLGLHRATQNASGSKIKHFETQGAAMAAYHRGEITLNDPIEIRSSRL